MFVLVLAHACASVIAAASSGGLEAGAPTTRAAATRPERGARLDEWVAWARSNNVTSPLTTPATPRAGGRGDGTTCRECVPSGCCFKDWVPGRACQCNRRVAWSARLLLAAARLAYSACPFPELAPRPSQHKNHEQLDPPPPPPPRP